MTTGIESTGIESTGTDSRDGRLPTLHVRGPADLVAAIPYLLGFHPDRSIVLVGLDHGRVVVSARADLAGVAESDALLPHTVAGMMRGGARRFVGVVFDDGLDPQPHGAALPWNAIARELADTVESGGGEVDEVVLVSRDRMWSYSCSLPECCPPQGVPLEESSDIAAAAIYAGLVALPDRDSVGQLLSPAAAADREALHPALAARERAALERGVDSDGGREERSVIRALFRAARRADLPGNEPLLPEADLVRFAVALRGYPVRDAVWLAIDDERLDGRSLWRQLAHRLPAPYDAPALFLFGWATYRRGDGALAAMAGERALASDPAYSAADLLLAALSQAVDPRRLPKLRSRRAR